MPASPVAVTRSLSFRALANVSSRPKRATGGLWPRQPPLLAMKHGSGRWFYCSERPVTAGPATEPTPLVAQTKGQVLAGVGPPEFLSSILWQESAQFSHSVHTGRMKLYYIYYHHKTDGRVMLFVCAIILNFAKQTGITTNLFKED